MEDRKIKSEVKTTLINLLLIALLSGGLLVISFTFASALIDIEMFKSYFKSGLLLFMNILPIFLILAFLWVVTNRLWLGFSITGLLIFAGGIANRTKLTYRDDPVIFSDVTLLSEAGMMAQKYEIPLTLRIILILLGIVVIAFILKKLLNFKLESNRSRLVIFLVLLVVSIGVFKGFYFREDIYNEVGDINLINRWIESQRYQSKGFIYPFVYSAKDLMDDRLENYDPKLAEEELNRFQYADIPEGKKVNVISIMLEAYNDFSEFYGIDLNTDVYSYFHKLQEESVHGKLLTNVFAGGTIDTERSFLTGYQNHPKYNRDTNSFAWYFKEQGYKTEAMHPITGSFYNRRNVNDYLGFDNFDYEENKYAEVSDDWLRDIDFFDFLIEGYEESHREGKPYFNFSVTYQNHGPYSKKAYSDNQILKKKDDYKDEDYNIINNYLSGIGETDKAIEKLIEHFRDEDEPVIVVLFGDHNPWLGEGNSVYKMLDINMDLSEEEGFKNYYQTPYLIWGNDKAREVSETGLIGERGAIGPSNLMAQVFEEMGWTGNEYMQYVKEFKRQVPVHHKEFFKEGENYRKELPEDKKKLWEDYKNVEYYQARNFKGKKDK